MMGYSAAVASSIAVALTLRKIFGRYTNGLTGGKQIAATAAISYIAVANAGFLNTYCMRLSEMKRGVAIMDEEGHQRGVSQEAAKSAVMQTAFSRTILPIPIFAVPGVFFYMLDRKGMMPKSKAVDVVL